MPLRGIELRGMVNTLALLNTEELYRLDRPLLRVAVETRGLIAELGDLCNLDQSRIPGVLMLTGGPENQGRGWTEPEQLQHQPLVGFKLRLEAWLNRCLDCDNPVEAAAILSALATEYWANYPEPKPTGA